MRRWTPPFSAAFCRRFLASFCWTALFVVCSWQHRTEACLDGRNLDGPSKGVLSPIVFVGQLEAIARDSADRVRVTFRLLKKLKSKDPPIGGLGKKRSPIQVLFLNNKNQTEFASNSANMCGLSVREEQKNERFLVYASKLVATGSTGHGGVTLIAEAAPDRVHKRTVAAVRKAVCKNCAKLPTVYGLKDTSVSFKSNLVLNCTASGQPPPTVEWFYKDTKKIKPKAGKISIKTIMKDSVLEINQVRPKDAGKYTCRASNVLLVKGVSVSAIVKVLRKSNHRTTQKLPHKHRTTTKVINTPTPTSTTTESPLWQYKGTKCSEETKERFCLNGGRCLFLRNIEEYACQCAEGFRGHRCESKDVNTEGSRPSSEGTSNYYSLFIAVVILGVLVCLNLGLFCCYIFVIVSKKRKTRNKNNEFGTKLSSYSSGCRRKSIHQNVKYTSPGYDVYDNNEASSAIKFLPKNENTEIVELPVPSRSRLNGLSSNVDVHLPNKRLTILPCASYDSSVDDIAKVVVESFRA